MRVFWCVWDEPICVGWVVCLFIRYQLICYHLNFLILHKFVIENQVGKYWFKPSREISTYLLNVEPCCFLRRRILLHDGILSWSYQDNVVVSDTFYSYTSPINPQHDSSWLLRRELLPHSADNRRSPAQRGRLQR